VDAALDFTADLTRSNTPESFFQEIQGLADGAGIAYKEMLRLQMFPELIKAQCSLLGAWGPATIQGSAAGGLVQLRALDWDTVTPLVRAGSERAGKKWACSCRMHGSHRSTTTS
jgi:hypothetical protein